MDNKLENNIDLDVSVSEQIADMQLMYLRQVAMNRVLSFDEIKTLEILSKVKNTEVSQRKTPEEDPKKARAKKLSQLAKSTKLNEIEHNDKEKDTISGSQRAIKS